MSQLPQGDLNPIEDIERSPSNHHSSSTMPEKSSTTPEKKRLPSNQSCLHPMLQLALESLDIDLDEELARYRHYLLVQQRVSSQYSSYPSLSVTSPFSFEFEGLDDSSCDSFPSEDTEVPITSTSTSDLSEIILSTSDQTPNDQNDQVDDQKTGDQGPDDQSSGTAWQSQSDAHLALSVGTDSTNLLTESFLPKPDDYLASSEELIKSLKQEEERAEAIASATTTAGLTDDRSLQESLFTPLGLGSILLLILSSATLGYLVLQPSTLEFITSWRGSEKGMSSGENPSALAPGQQQGGLSNLAPDLAAGEFDPLRASHLSSLPAVVDANQSDPITISNVDNVEGTENKAQPNGSSTPVATELSSGVLDNTAAIASPAVPAESRAPIVSRATRSSPLLPVIAPQAAPRYTPPAPAPSPAPRNISPAPTPAPTPAPVPVSAPSPSPQNVSPEPAPAPAPSPVTPTPVISSPLPSLSENRDAITPLSATESSPNTTRIRVEELPTPLEAPVSPATTPSISVSAPVSERSTNQRAVSPSEASTTSSTASSIVPSPPAASPPTLASPPVRSAPIKEDLYYVTTPYTGDQSLETAQDAISGSYVRSFPQGTQVQMGAFSNASGAEELVQDLQDQGIRAEVYEGGGDN